MYCTPDYETKQGNMENCFDVPTCLTLDVLKEGI